ncbi:hypothetical protein ACOMHN_065373 [Nucella lapillus]
MLESEEAEVGDLNATTEVDSVTEAESDGADTRCVDSSQQEKHPAGVNICDWIFLDVLEMGEEKEEETGEGVKCFVSR